MSLRNGIWHGLRNDIIMRNDPVNWKVRPFFGANQFANAAAVLMLTYTMTIKKPRRPMSISLFRTATKIRLAFISRAAWQRRYYSTKVGQWRKDVLEGNAPFYLTNFFLQKMFARLTLQFPFTYICICNHVRSVSFSDHGLRDRGIIFRDEKGSYILFPL